MIDRKLPEWPVWPPAAKNVVVDDTTVYYHALIRALGARLRLAVRALDLIEGLATIESCRQTAVARECLFEIGPLPPEQKP